jgi:protein TonB
MSVAIATVHPRRRLGPALRRVRVPFGGLALSALLHVSLAAMILLAGHAWRASQPKTYVVNLVPAVPAIGSPQSRATETATPAPALPEREPARPVERPTRPTDLPERTRAPRESLALPDRTSPSRTPALPRPGEKELPPVASAAQAPARAAAAAPPTPVGRPTGSPQGAGAISLDGVDFPFTWYLRQVESKISQRWQGKGQPQVIFEIVRDGTIRAVTVGKSSGNYLDDQAAMRAVTEAAPFPPLPEEFRETFLRVHMGFHYSGMRG